MTTTQDILHTLGIGRRYKGHAIVLAAADYILQEESGLQCASASLYPPLSARFSCSPSAVERDIRTVISCAWRTNPQYLTMLAGYPLTQQPTVKEFLDILVSYLLREGRKAPGQS